jgi:hypothetical protein
LQLATAKDMEMDVKNGLAGGGAIVKDHTEAVNQLEIFGQLRAYAHHSADQLLVFGLNECRANNMLFRDDQKMDRRLGRDIPESQELLVFIEFVSWNLASNDLTEKTVFVHDILQII